MLGAGGAPSIGGSRSLGEARTGVLANLGSQYRGKHTRGAIPASQGSPTQSGLSQPVRAFSTSQVGPDLLQTADGVQVLDDHPQHVLNEGLGS